MAVQSISLNHHTLFPNVLVLTRGTTSCPRVEERKDVLPDTQETGKQDTARYAGARPWRQRKVKVQTSVFWQQRKLACDICISIFSGINMKLYWIDAWSYQRIIYQKISVNYYIKLYLPQMQ